MTEADRQTGRQTVCVCVCVCVRANLAKGGTAADNPVPAACHHLHLLSTCDRDPHTHTHMLHTRHQHSTSALRHQPPLTGTEAT